VAQAVTAAGRRNHGTARRPVTCRPAGRTDHPTRSACAARETSRADRSSATPDISRPAGGQWSGQVGCAPCLYTCYGWPNRVLPPCWRQPGSLRGRRGLQARKSLDNTVEPTTHTIWESLAAIRAFAGEDITNSVVEPEAQSVLLNFDRTATLCRAKTRSWALTWLFAPARLLCDIR